MEIVRCCCCQNLRMSDRRCEHPHCPESKGDGPIPTGVRISEHLDCLSLVHFLSLETGHTTNYGILGAVVRRGGAAAREREAKALVEVLKHEAEAAAKYMRDALPDGEVREGATLLELARAICTRAVSAFRPAAAPPPLERSSADSYLEILVERDILREQVTALQTRGTDQLTAARLAMVATIRAKLVALAPWLAIGQHPRDVNEAWKDVCDRAARSVASYGPLPIVTRCPKCYLQHVDKGEWETRPHRTHRCVGEGGCGTEWAPARIHTVGVAEVS